MDVAIYAPAIRELLAEGRLPPLGPGTPNDKVRARLEELTIESLFAPERIHNADFAQCCLSGLWLHHDFLEPSHQLSQEIETASGRYWHGLMHRREPDFGNAKYWFRRVGKHPVFTALHQAAQDMARREEVSGQAAWLTAQAAWDPFAFLDLCEAAYEGRVDWELLCRHIQDHEWGLLFDYCYRRAVGSQL